MKKYLIPEMEVELFDGQDLFTSHSGGTGGACPCETSYDPEAGCDDLGFAPGVCFNITVGGDEGPGI